MTELHKIQNPYAYPGTDVLRNHFGIKDPYFLNEVERRLAISRLDELQETPIRGNFDYNHLKAIHKYVFQDVYDWAGTERIMTIGKGGKIFCHAGEIDTVQKHIFYQIKNQNYLKDLNPEQFAQKASVVLKDLNYLHPFPEGNGRTQREFMRELAINAGYELNLSNVPREYMIFASREGMDGNTKEFERIIQNQLKPMNEFKLKGPTMER